MAKSPRRLAGAGLMLLLFLFVSLMAAFMGGAALSPDMDPGNRAIAIGLFVGLMPSVVALGFGLRRSLLGRWLTHRRWSRWSAQLMALGFREATTDEIERTGRIPAHVLHPSVLAPQRGGGIDHVFVGSAAGSEVRCFNVRIRGGGWADAPVVAVRMSTSAPATVIFPVGRRRALRPRPELKPVGFELEAFDRSYAVFSADPYFANAMIDARMMDWLMTDGARATTELADRWMLARKIPRRGQHLDPLQLMAYLEAFADHVPRSVPSLFPAKPEELFWRSRRVGRSRGRRDPTPR